MEDRKSTFGCWFSLGSSSISWMSRKQNSISLSTDEVGYITVSMASCEAVWLWKLFSELLRHMLDTIVIFCDNQRGIRLLRNLVFYDHSKHIGIKDNLIWDMVHRGTRRIHRIGTNVQVTDILSKPLGKVKFLTFQ